MDDESALLDTLCKLLIKRERRTEQKNEVHSQLLNELRFNTGNNIISPVNYSMELVHS